MQKLFLVTLSIAVLGGCTVRQAKPIEWSAVGGSRADATVKLQYSYTHGTPNPDINQAINLAKSRCASWGYASAELFGGESRGCSGVLAAGVLGVPLCQGGEWTVTKDFQCTGDGVALKQPPSAPVLAPAEEEEPIAAPVKKSKKKK